MTTRRTETAPTINLLPILAGLVALCLVIAGILTALTRNSAPVAAPSEQLSLVVQRMPFEAQNALRGDASSFDALARARHGSRVCAPPSQVLQMQPGAN